MVDSVATATKRAIVGNKKTTERPGSGTQPRVAGAQSIDRALDVLACFIDERDLGITELSRALELSPSTAHRIVQALVARGYLEQSPATERYHLGASAIVLGQAARSSFGLERAMPVLEELGQLTGESINMGLRDGDHVVVVLHVESTQPLRFDQPVGTRRSMHSTSMGKALLAFAPDRKTANFDDILQAATSRTITDADELRAHLDEVRKLGYSTDTEESLTGVSCLGAPVLNSAGDAVAAIAVQGPTARMSTVDRPLLGKQVARAANQIAALLSLEMLDDFGSASAG